MYAIFEKIFDAYTRKARLYPAFLALLPVMTVIAAYTDWGNLEPASALWLIVIFAALHFLSDFTRQLGKTVEKKLLAEWGGFPSKTLLRHGDENIDPVTTQRYHRAAERLIEGVTMPTAEEEQADRKRSDDAYNTVTQFLLPRTRDTATYGLLLKENINYGFRRNMLGLRSIAIFILIASAVFVIWQAWAAIEILAIPNQRELTLLIGAVVLLFAWIFLVTKDRVRAAGVDYAKQLLMCLDTL